MSRASHDGEPDARGEVRARKDLGEGSFAKVKFVRNTQSSGESAVAIKIIDRHLVLSSHMVEQIKREISTMKMIKHPNVLNILEVMASRTKIYTVLEHVGGGKLFDKIARQEKLEEGVARSYFQQLINIVDYYHSRGRWAPSHGLWHTKLCSTRGVQ